MFYQDAWGYAIACDIIEFVNCYGKFMIGARRSGTLQN